MTRYFSLNFSFEFFDSFPSSPFLLLCFHHSIISNFFCSRLRKMSFKLLFFIFHILSRREFSLMEEENINLHLSIKIMVMRWAWWLQLMMKCIIMNSFDVFNLLLIHSLCALYVTCMSKRKGTFTLQTLVNFLEMKSRNLRYAFTW